MDKYFMVTCHGWSGSNWMATALNRHPDIICTHSAANTLPHDDGSGYSQKEEDASSKAGLLSQRHGESLEGHYQWLQELGDAQAYGSVHKYRLRDLPQFFPKGGTVKFPVVNQIRNPVSLVASGQGQFTQMCERDILTRNEVLFFFSQNKQFYFDLANKYNLDLCDWSIVSFLAACQHMYVLASEVDKFRAVKQFKMEELTTQPQVLRQLVTLIGRERIAVSDDYLAGVYELGRVNQHKRAAAMTPEQQFESWQSWQRESFLYFFKRSIIGDLYSSLGYKFNYLAAA